MVQTSESRASFFFVEKFHLFFKKRKKKVIRRTGTRIVNINDHKKRCSACLLYARSNFCLHLITWTRRGYRQEYSWQCSGRFSCSNTKRNSAFRFLFSPTHYCSHVNRLLYLYHPSQRQRNGRENLRRLTRTAHWLDALRESYINPRKNPFSFSWGEASEESDDALAHTY